MSEICSLSRLGLVAVLAGILGVVPGFVGADGSTGSARVADQALASGCAKVSEATFALEDQRGQPQGLTTVTCTSTCSGTGNCSGNGCDASAFGCSSFSCFGLDCGAGDCTKTSTYTPSESIIGTGFGFDSDDFAGPATIAYLYEDSNQGIFEVGDVILEYQGIPVRSGADLYQAILALPDVAPGQVVPMLLSRGTAGTVISAGPIARSIEIKDVETVFGDRICADIADVCTCVAGAPGSTCVQTMHTGIASDGETLVISSSCRTGETGSIKANPTYRGK